MCTSNIARADVSASANCRRCDVQAFNGLHVQEGEHHCLATNYHVGQCALIGERLARARCVPGVGQYVLERGRSRDRPSTVTAQHAGHLVNLAHAPARFLLNTLRTF